MKRFIAFGFMLICSLYSCDQKNELPVVTIDTNGSITFNSEHFDSPADFSTSFNQWMSDQFKGEPSPFVEFRPKPNTPMKHVNEIKDVLKMHHSNLRVGVQAKDGSQTTIKLPPKMTMESSIGFRGLNPRNILKLTINKDGIFKDSFEGKSISLGEVERLILDYIHSDGTDPELPARTFHIIPNKGRYLAAKKLIVSLTPSKDVSFSEYQKLKWEIHSAYADARNSKSMEVYGRYYDGLGSQEKEVVNTIIPMVLSEFPAE